MGDNDFIAGDPWGLPIEDSEDVEIEVARPDDEEGAPQPQSDLEAGPDDEEEPVFSAEGETDFEGQVSRPAGPAPDEPTGVEEPEAGSDVRWSSEEPEPVASGYEVAAEENPDLDEEAEGKEEEYTFRAPSRTPLSQMIAAAQIVVNSVQEEQPDGAEQADEADDSEPDDADRMVADEVADRGEPPTTEIDEPSTPVSAHIPDDTPVGDDDLPSEPPSWMIVDGGTDQEQAGTYPAGDTAEPAEVYGAVDDQTFTPDDIEASMAGLATPEPPEAPFAEDRFEMAGEEEPETNHEFGGVDMNSSPAVYSELHNLADQDEQAEALLQEAAEAFGQSDESVESVAEELLPTPEDIDRYADALATELGTDETTIEPVDDALSTVDYEGFMDADASAHLSEGELSEALAGLAEASTHGAESADEDGEEGIAPADWWGGGPESVVRVVPIEELSDQETVPFDEIAESVDQVAEEPDILTVEPAEDDRMEESQEPPEAGAGTEPAEQPAVVIDSTVAWGTGYRQAHEGWVEDDEGRSNWRPIVTSGESVAGWDIDIYLGLVSGDVTIDPGSAQTVAREVGTARESAVRRMLDEALARGAHAVVGVTFSIQDIAGTVLVTASGVAVTLRTPA